MTRFTAFMLLLLLLLAGCSKQQQLDSHPVQSDTWVVDKASVFTDSGQARLRRILQRIHKSTGVQFVVATMIKADRAKAIELFNMWKLGTSTENNGILLMISRDDRGIEIVTGSGLDSTLPANQLQQLLRETVIPQMRAGRAEEATAEAAKEIGWKLRGTRPQAPPQTLLLLLTIFGAALGLGGTAYLYRQLYSPLILQPTGRRDHARDFSGLYKAAFFRAEAEAIDPKNARVYAASTVRLAWIGLSLLAAGLAGFAASLTSEDPRALPLWAIASVCALFTTLALQPLVDGDWEKVRVSVIVAMFLAAMPAGYVVSNFVSPFVASMIAAAFALVVNAMAGWLWYRDLAGASARVERMSCAKCKGGLALIEPKEFLNSWEKSAVEAKRLSFRGWHCKNCFPKADQAYLSCSIHWEPVACQKCKQFAVNPVLEKKNTRSLLCKACGHKRPDPDWKPTKSGSSSAASSFSSSSTESSSHSSSSDYESSNWDQSTSYDPPEAGGSTSGGGAGDNW